MEEKVFWKLTHSIKRFDGEPATARLGEQKGQQCEPGAPGPVIVAKKQTGHQTDHRSLGALEGLVLLEGSGDGQEGSYSWKDERAVSRPALEKEQTWSWEPTGNIDSAPAPDGVLGWGHFISWVFTNSPRGLLNSK